MLQTITSTVCEIVSWVDFKFTACPRVRLLFLTIDYRISESWIRRVGDPSQPQSLIASEIRKYF